MRDTREKQDIRQENQECLKRAEDEIEHRRQRAESFGLAPGDKAGSIGRLRSFCEASSAKGAHSPQGNGGGELRQRPVRHRQHGQHQE